MLYVCHFTTTGNILDIGRKGLSKLPRDWAVLSLASPSFAVDSAPAFAIPDRGKGKLSVRFLQDLAFNGERWNLGAVLGDTGEKASGGQFQFAGSLIARGDFAFLLFPQLLSLSSTAIHCTYLTRF